MGAEERRHLATREGIDDEQMRTRGIVLGIGVRQGTGGRLQPPECARQGQRLARDPCTRLVGAELAGARDRKLHQHRRQRRKDDDENDAQNTQRIVAVVPEEQGKVGKHRNGAGNDGGQCHHQRVTVPDMAELMGDHAFQLVVVQNLEQPAGRRNRGMLRIAPGGKGVGLVGFDHIDRRHREPRSGGQPAHGRDKTPLAHGIRRPGPIHSQHELIRLPVGPDVHRPGKQQGENHAAGAADQIADGQKQTRQRRQQKSRPEKSRGHRPVLVLLSCRMEPSRRRCGDEGSPRQSRRR